MLTPAKPSHLGSHVPFDADRLDRLMDEAGLDVLVATSKHNVQYLLGGHRALFFDYMDAMGVSRYLPVFVYVKGATDKAAYFGHRLEGYQRQVKPFWVATAETASSGSVDAMQKAIDHIRRLHVRPRRIGVEMAFLSLDSGGNYHGYIGDVARMAILGEPDAELDELLAEIEDVQRAAFGPIKAGAMGGEIYAAAEPLVRRSRQHNHLHFLAHGMGLVSHEAPRLTSSGPVPYTDDDAHRPLEAGMVISVETTLLHPRRGFIKLEDTVAVTEEGYEVYGDRARGWLRGGSAL